MKYILYQVTLSFFVIVSWIQTDLKEADVIMLNFRKNLYTHRNSHSLSVRLKHRDMQICKQSLWDSCV